MSSWNRVSILLRRGLLLAIAARVDRALGKTLENESLARFSPKGAEDHSVQSD